MADRKVNMNRVQVACVALLACALLVPGRAGYSAETPSELNRRGVELGRQEKYKEALQKFDRSISLYDKSSARTFHNKAWVLELKGETDEAIKNYEEAVRRNPLQVPSHERVGYLYYTTGQYEKAVTTGEYVLEIDPDNREVVKWLSDAYKMRIQQRQEELLARKEKEKKEAEKQPAAEEEKEAEKKQEEQKRLLYVTYDSLFREGYYFGGTGFAYIKDNGAGPDYVNMLHVNLTPGTSWELDVLTG
ncbi:MAG TPA: tetratricopeptide repeat protein, partial [Spirochaetota bacterium]|nr:tetratricopeptide repeat protein [Spirochaetota bacterium]